MMAGSDPPALPVSFNVVVPGRVGKQYPSGLHDVDGVWLYVSRGVGGIEVPFRTFAKPEVVVLTLTA